MTVKQYLGVRYDLVMTMPNRWSSGKTHLTYWDRLNKQWALNCRDEPGLPPYHTVPIVEPRPENCLRCDDMIKQVFG